MRPSHVAVKNQIPTDPWLGTFVRGSPADSETAHGTVNEALLPGERECERSYLAL